MTGINLASFCLEISPLPGFEPHPEGAADVALRIFAHLIFPTVLQNYVIILIKEKESRGKI